MQLQISTGTLTLLGTVTGLWYLANTKPPSVTTVTTYRMGWFLGRHGKPSREYLLRKPTSQWILHVWPTVSLCLHGLTLFRWRTGKDILPEVPGQSRLRSPQHQWSVQRYFRWRFCHETWDPNFEIRSMLRNQISISNKKHCSNISEHTGSNQIIFGVV